MRAIVAGRQRDCAVADPLAEDAPVDGDQRRRDEGRAVPAQTGQRYMCCRPYRSVQRFGFLKLCCASTTLWQVEHQEGGRKSRSGALFAFFQERTFPTARRR